MNRRAFIKGIPVNASDRLGGRIDDPDACYAIRFHNPVGIAYGELVNFDDQEYVKLARAMAGIRTAYLYDIDPLAPRDET